MKAKAVAFTGKYHTRTKIVINEWLSKKVVEVTFLKIVEKCI
jgi:hypothetical protein